MKFELEGFLASLRGRAARGDLSFIDLRAARGIIGVSERMLVAIDARAALEPSRTSWSLDEEEITDDFRHHLSGCESYTTSPGFTVGYLSQWRDTALERLGLAEEDPMLEAIAAVQESAPEATPVDASEETLAMLEELATIVDISIERIATSHWIDVNIRCHDNGELLADHGLSLLIRLDGPRPRVIAWVDANRPSVQPTASPLFPLATDFHGDPNEAEDPEALVPPYLE